MSLNNMKNLNIGSIKIPVTAATKSFAVLAKRGAGKTYTSAVIAEEFDKAHVPFVVFDPIDVWYGLRLAADGKSKGLPVVVFGLEHADIKIDRDMGRQIARAIVKENISCVISTFGMPKVAQRHLIAEFSEELLNINNTPRHVFIEEAHEFVPQRIDGGMAKCFSAVEALVTMGRNRGIGVTLINQRAATLNKDVLTQVDTLVALRSVGPQDRKAIKEWVEAHSADGDMDEFIDSLPSLPTGTAWIWSPEFMGVFEKITIRKRETFHPDREKLGANFEIPKLNQGDIQGFIDSFSKKPEKAVASGSGGPGGAGGAGSPSGGGSDGSRRPFEQVYSKTQVDKMIVDALNARDTEMFKERSEFIRHINTLMKTITIISKSCNEIINEKYPLMDVQMKPLVKADIKNTRFHNPGGVSLMTEPEGDSSVLEKCPRMIYSFLYSRAPRAYTKEQIACATNYGTSSGGFKSGLARLKVLGLIEKREDKYVLIEKDPDVATFKDQDFSIDTWLSHLEKCPREIFKFLRDNDNSGIGFSKESIANGTNYGTSSGGFKSGLSRLKVLDLIKKEGYVYFINPDLENL